MFYSAPTYNLDSQTWSNTYFKNKIDVIKYIESNFKHPGEYNIQQSHRVWNQEGVRWKKEGMYCNYVKNSLDFRKYWDFEKEKCNIDGFIIYKSSTYEQAVPGMYHWYLNFTPIYDKRKKKIIMGQIWDGDLHTFLALLLCRLKGKHFVCLKKRQFGMTLKLTSVLLLGVWFSEGAKGKIFSYQGVHMENSWVFLEQYRDHINKFCGWKRGFEPNKFLDWQIRRRATDGTYVGNMSILKGLSTEKDASKPVGGGVDIAFGEEAGINPNLNKTHEYMKPSVGMGGLTTGLLMYAGSVGELDKCEPLKNYIFQPFSNGFLAFENLCEGDEDLGAEVGFFVPEWWNYIDIDETTMEEVECFDQNGNTDKQKALEIIKMRREQAKKSDAESYRYFCSQRPLSIKEAFSYRKESIFPQALLARQELRISRGDYPYQSYDIERGAEGVPIFVKAKHLPIEAFPYSPKKDETPFGAIKVWEQPIKDAKFGTYFAAVDPIAVDTTSTSESLYSIVIYRNLTQVEYREGEENKLKLEGDKIVAAYVGRKETVLKTNELGELLIQKYNAFAVIENNVDNFIKHMISQHKQKYLAMKSDLPFLKELVTNTESFQEYGVRTNATMWNHYINKILEYLKEELSVEHMNNGEILKTVYGVERIPDSRLIKELLSFTDEKGNYDQIVTFGLVIALAKSRQANGLITKVREEGVEDLVKISYKYPRSPFKSSGVHRRAFKNIK